MSKNVSFKHVSNYIGQHCALEPAVNKNSSPTDPTISKIFDIGFICRSITFASIPHSKVNNNQYLRTNHNFTISITGNEAAGGVPYGVYPRLILCWLTSEIVKTKSRKIILGNNLTHFMKKLGLSATGGKWGTITRFKSQVIKLLTSSISITYCNLETGKMEHTNMNIVDKTRIIWDPMYPKEISAFGSQIILGESFYKEVIKAPIPIDMEAINFLKSSSFALDIYFWLTYRMSYLKYDIELSFNKLQLQFGIGYENTSHGRYEFKRKFLHQLNNVLVIYPEAKVHVKSDSIVISPSLPHIKKKHHKPVEPKLQILK